MTTLLHWLYSLICYMLAISQEMFEYNNAVITLWKTSLLVQKHEKWEGRKNSELRTQKFIQHKTQRLSTNTS